MTSGRRSHPEGREAFTVELQEKRVAELREKERHSRLFELEVVEEIR
jgi:hypothetical protein